MKQFVEVQNVRHASILDRKERKEARKADVDDSTSNKQQLALPLVFSTQLRPDIVSRVHDLMMKNTRQPHAVASRAGKTNSAKSWHTGRAVSRVTRYKGSGTSIAGSGARANFCRGGHMAHPLTLDKRWGRLITVKERRLAVQSAIAASRNAALVQSHGHLIENMAYIPCVVSNDAESFTKTKQAVEMLKQVKAYGDVLKAWNSRRLRAGRGKMRNRRYKMKRGPLVVFKNDEGITRAFRNVPGISLMCVDSPNLLKLAPGGKLGRLIIWTQAAFESLDQSLPFVNPQVSQVMKTTSLNALKNSIRNCVRPDKKLNSKLLWQSYHSTKKVNALKSKILMKRIIPENRTITEKYASVMNMIST